MVAKRFILAAAIVVMGAAVLARPAAAQEAPKIKVQEAPKAVVDTAKAKVVQEAPKVAPAAAQDAAKVKPGVEAVKAKAPAAAQEAPKAMPGVTTTMQMAPAGITGTWMLMSRELPDGTKQMPPAVSGMLTYTAKYRNFNVMWKDAAGKKVTISYAAEYKLTPTEYSETPMVWVMTNEAGPEKVSYTWPADKTMAQPVTLKEGRTTFAVSGELPTLTFEGDTMTAVAKGQFTDHWQRVSGK